MSQAQLAAGPGPAAVAQRRTDSVRRQRRGAGMAGSLARPRRSSPIAGAFLSGSARRLAATLHRPASPRRVRPPLRCRPRAAPSRCGSRHSPRWRPRRSQSSARSAAAGHDRQAPETVRKGRRRRNAGGERTALARCGAELAPAAAPAPSAAGGRAGQSGRSADRPPPALGARRGTPGAADLWPARVSSGAYGRLVQIGAFGSRLQAKQGWRQWSALTPALSGCPRSWSRPATRVAAPSTASRSAPPRRRIQRSAVPADGEDPLQLRRRRPAAEAQGHRALSDSHRDYDEQLPWLQAVEDEDEPRGLSARKMLAALAVVMLAGLIVAGDLLLARAQPQRG